MRSTATRIASIETPAESGSPGPGRDDDAAQVRRGVVGEGLEAGPVDGVVAETRTSAPAASSAWTRLKVKES